MNETPQNLSPELASYAHLAALKYALAGDVESGAPLETLFHRLGEINWNDPAFIQFSEQVRTGLPKPDPDQAGAPAPSPGEIIWVLKEYFAEKAEDRSVLKSKLQTIVKGFDHALAMIKTLTDLHQKMSDRLKALDVDISEYKLPEL